MTRPLRFLTTSPTTAAASTGPPPPPTEQVDSDFVVILAALLCALICVLGLAAVVRCAWLRRFTNSGTTTNHLQQQQQHQRPPSAANKGLKKKVLRSLPTQPYSPEFKDSDCAICLAEFGDGDELRVLPQCGHGFHVACIDTWLGSHSSCPSCRQILVVGRCKKCGGVPSPPAPAPVRTETSADAAGSSEVRRKERGDDDAANRYLP